MNPCRFILPVSFAALMSACGSSIESTPDITSACNGAETSTERLFLQQVSSSSAIVKWRGAADTLCYGTTADALDQAISASTTATEHKEAALSGLEPDTQYYYSVGAAGSAPAGQYFRTAPATGTLPADGNTHIWIIGDSGTVGTGDDFPPPDAPKVRDGFMSYNAANGNEDLDLFLMLGDNAYLDGSDKQYQAGVFEVYPDLLNKVALWPTIGNHEMGSFGISTSSDINSYTADTDPDETSTYMPYIDIFTLPTQAEAGGVASGSEQYYSFNYGNIHIVSLDSQVTIRDATNRETMKNWLIQDLMANTADWTIVIYHHPPYTKGSHDSDDPLNGIDQPIFDIREQFIPIFEQYGVDVAYAGHSHSYERSWYLNGHYGLSTTFDAATMSEVDSAGQSLNGQDAQRYQQISAGSGVDDKVVYTVAGSSGYLSHMKGVHPANFSSLEKLGSVVLDASATTLEARFIDDTGAVLDWFTITR